MAAMLFQAAFWGTAMGGRCTAQTFFSKKINSLLDRMSDGPLIVAGFSVRYQRAGAHDRLHEIFSRFLYFSLNIIFLMK